MYKKELEHKIIIEHVKVINGKEIILEKITYQGFDDYSSYDVVRSIHGRWTTYLRLHKQSTNITEDFMRIYSKSPMGSIPETYKTQYIPENRELAEQCIDIERSHYPDTIADKIYVTGKLAKGQTFKWINYKQDRYANEERF